MSSTTTLKAILLGEDRSMGKTFKGVGRDAEAAGKKTFGFGGLAKKGFGLAAGAMAAAGLAVGFGELVTQISGAVTEASNLQQALGGSEAVFGKFSGRMEENATGAADALGLSKSAYLELATVLGAGLKNKGLKDYAAQSENLVEIGADLAAQYGGSTKDAVDALGSAMRGESDPIERYGISLNEAAVNAKLAEMGVKKVNGSFTEQQKTMGRLALVTDQSKDALGAFGRESNTLAGSNARLTANWDNMKGQIGAKLLPMLTKLSSWFLNKGLPAVEKFGGWLTGSLWPAMQKGYQTVMPGVQDALSILGGAFGEGGFSMKKFGEVITKYVIPAAAIIGRVWLPWIATQIRVVIEVVKLIVKWFKVWADVTRNVAIGLLTAFAGIARGFATLLRGLSKIPGFGWAKDAADKMDGAADKADGLASALRKIPGSKSIGFTALTGGAVSQISVLQRKINSVTGKSVTVRVRYVTEGRLPSGGLSFAGGSTRASGGPVVKGRSYLVGENGPEIWSGDSGSITPARQTAKLLAGRLSGGGSSSSGGYDGPDKVQLILDGRVIHEALLRRKRQGGMNMGLA